ncbi:hypothetical protein QE385_003563 [Sphingomonas sp. SORGH_AS 950]|nr:hypothetical protein [Sphingomonas sp. SORGH_AS_0950]
MSRKLMTPGKLWPGHRDDERVGAGRDQQPVIVQHHAALGGHRPAHAIDRGDGIAADQGDAVASIPVEPVDDDLVERLLARQHRRQHDPVVIHQWLGAEDGDAVAAGIARQQFLDRTAPGHAVANDDEVLAGIGRRDDGGVFHQMVQSSWSQNFLVSAPKRSA